MRVRRKPGQSTKLRICRLAVLALSLGAVATSHAYTQAQVDTAWKYGIWWLFAQQSGDGYWKTGNDPELITTALGVEALYQAPLRTYPFSKALAWVNSTRALSVDALARQAAAIKLAGGDPSGRLNLLLNWKNSSAQATWGAYDRYQTSLPDTPLALTALRAGAPAYTYSGQTLQHCRAVAHLHSIQRADKGWAPYSAGNPIGAASSLLATTYTLFELRSARDGVPSGTDCPSVSSLDTAINDGIGWLMGKRKADGGFGEESTSAILATALAYNTLKAVCTGTPVYSQCPVTATIDTAVDYLIAQQRPDGQAHAGSWGSDALLTALVLNVMSAYPATRPQAAILLDTDGDGIPDSVEPLMGKNPNVADSGFPSSGGTASSLQLHSVVDERAFAGRNFRVDLFAVGGTPPYSWQMVSGALPPGLTLNASGSITGVPPAVGTFNFAYKVADNAGASVSTNGRLRVFAEGDWNGDGVVDRRDDAILLLILNGDD